MDLKNTEKFIKDKLNEELFGSYAVLVSINGNEKLITSPDVDKDTYFDVASMTKVLSTSTLALKAISLKKLNLEDTLDMFFDFDLGDKSKIKIKNLLTHTSGIVRYKGIDNEISKKGKDEVAKFILSFPLAFKTGTNEKYFCNGMILMGFILEKIFGIPLDMAFEKYIKEPLLLTRSKFNILWDEENAVNSYRWKEVTKYRVDDEQANALGGVAGNAGAFFTICDIQKFISAILRKDEALYSKELFDIAEKNYTPNFENGRGLGYLVVNENYSQTGNLFPPGSFGHCGHSGTSFFINRKLNLYAVILTNATRYLNIRSGFKGYNYGIVTKMREDIHNEILKDLKEQNLL
ncbi:MAG: beta-lactamase family protein [Ruminococcaceae bacterium]|nr:beta-lactamase family protein [Oscillospiraceae bacterium]